jgi:hypothetical protein
MKNTTVRNLRFLTLSALLAGCVPMRAADAPVEVRWSELCRTAQNRELEITTATGETVDGYCVSINADEVGIRTGGKIVKLGRTALSRVHMERAQGHQLRSLGRGMHSGLKQGANWLLSPAALAGIVTIPATLAWGAVSAPFCILGDLKHHLLGKQEIKLI